jgi:hypothetical protein
MADILPPAPAAPEPPAAPASAPAPAAAPPPAAAVVIEGQKTEREIKLEKDLEEARQARLTAETKASYAEDKARQLEERLRPAPAPVKVPRDRWTLLHEVD